MDNISFQCRSNIHLTPTILRETVEKVNLRKNNLNNISNRTLVNGQTLLMKPDPDHISVIVANGKTGFLKRFPLTNNIENKVNEIADSVDELVGKSKEKLTAWIIGGDRMNGKNGNKTVNWLNKIADILCERSDIDTSILMGSKRPEDKILVHPILDKLELVLEKPKTATLDDCFDIIELNNTNII